MPRNALNAAFVADPATFIANAHHGVGGHDDLQQATKGTRERTIEAGSDDARDAAVLLELINATNVISFDFHEYRKDLRRMLVMKPLMDTTLWKLGDAPGRFGAQSSNPVRGHWFPYLTATPQEFEAAKSGDGPPSIMGYVDFKHTDPEYPFVFTGSMQGCAIVVTKSPAKPATHWRAYHYPNVKEVADKAGDMSFHLWPAVKGGKVLAWLADTDYEHQAPEAVDAFNFLHYSGGRWRIHTQKQKRHVLISGRTGVILFEVMGTRSSAPIDGAGLSTGDLVQMRKRWLAARSSGKRKAPVRSSVKPSLETITE